MVSLVKTKDVNYNTNLVANKSVIRTVRLPNARQTTIKNWSKGKLMHWESYQIKETDPRVKTASFTSPEYLDLTTGLFAVLISSPHHENFSGIVIKSEYDPDNELYTYQCQDWRRQLITKFSKVFNGKYSIYNIIRNFLTHGKVSLTPTKAQLEKYKWELSGLRPAYQYEQGYYGSAINFNPMTDKPRMVINNKSYIDSILDFIHGQGAYIDVHFNDCGVLQFEPYTKSEFENTGLHLTSKELISSKYDFDPTNMLAGVVVKSNEKLKSGKYYSSGDVLNLDLSAFFGMVTSVVDNPNKQNNTTTNKAKNTAISKKSNNATTKSNPYNKKARKVWINADNGSNAKKNDVANALRKQGWTVKVSGTGPNWHYKDYFNVSSDYSVYITLYNGFCAGTIREAYSSKIQNVLKKKGVQLVVMWDSAGWTNPKGMKPYQYGDFNGYNAGRAWDDNFSSGNPSISNVGKYLKDNNAKYCVHPTTAGLITQFLKGGYFATKK